MKILPHQISCKLDFFSRYNFFTELKSTNRKPKINRLNFFNSILHLEFVSFQNCQRPLINCTCQSSPQDNSRNEIRRSCWPSVTLQQFVIV
jgi:hypothetical protein